MKRTIRSIQITPDVRVDLEPIRGGLWSWKLYQREVLMGYALDFFESQEDALTFALHEARKHGIALPRVVMFDGEVFAGQEGYAAFLRVFAKSLGEVESGDPVDADELQVGQEMGDYFRAIAEWIEKAQHLGVEFASAGTVLSPEQAAALVAWANQNRLNGTTAWGPKFDAAMAVAMELKDAPVPVPLPITAAQLGRPGAEVCVSNDGPPISINGGQWIVTAGQARTFACDDDGNWEDVTPEEPKRDS